MIIQYSLHIASCITAIERDLVGSLESSIPGMLAHHHTPVVVQQLYVLVQCLTHLFFYKVELLILLQSNVQEQTHDSLKIIISQINFKRKFCVCSNKYFL